MAKNSTPTEFVPLSHFQKAMVLFSVTYSVAYFSWRATSTINSDVYPVYSWLFYALDLFGFLSSLLFMTATWRLRNRRSIAPSGKYSVDAYIPTFNESPELLRTTIYNVLKMDYPHETYLLDDGCRPEVRELAESMGAKYITRSDNRGAKAGNMNNAMTQTQGDLIAVFDADGIPRKDFLLKTIGYFEDEKVAMVQTPNAFYNLDSFQHWSENSGKNTWHDQALWFDVIQRGLDFGDAAVWCGSGSLLKRQALKAVGGISTESVTEDMLTTLRLHEAGYKTIFHDEPIAFCLAPTSIEPYLVQRGRWAMGSIQIMKREFFGLLSPGKLTFHQRIAYLMSFYYFTSIQKLLYYVSPLVFLGFGISPVKQPDELLIPLLVYVLLSVYAFKILARGTGRVFRGEVYFLHLVPIYIKAIFLGLLPFFKGRFRVTSKDPTEGVPLKYWLSPVLLIAVSAIAIGAGVVKNLDQEEVSFGVLLTMGVATYYLFVSLSAALGMRKAPLSMETYSFFDYRPIQIKSHGEAVQINSTLGIAFVISDDAIQAVHMGPLPIGEIIKFDLDLPDSSLSLEGRATRCEPWVIRGMDPLFIVDLKLESLSQRNRDELLRYFFEDATPRAMNTTARIVRESVSKVEKEDQRRKSTRLNTLLPIIIEAGASGLNRQIGLLVDVSREGALLKFPAEIQVGEQIRVQMPWIKKSVLARVARCKKEEGQANPPFHIGITFNEAIEIENQAMTEFSQLKAAI